eukprot:jgi/Bigna1/36727/e_gw1.15.19.1
MKRGHAARLKKFWKEARARQSSFSTKDLAQLELIVNIGNCSGFGFEVLAKTKADGKLVLLKLFHKNTFEEKVVYGGLINQMKILREKPHPFLPRLLFGGHTKTHVWQALEHVNGGELFKLLGQKKRLSHAYAQFLISEMILTVEHIHSHGFIHRDLKPENFFFRSNGHLVLHELSLAKFIGFEGGAANTFCGTPEYMPPELIKGSSSFASDWWAVGCMLYEFLIGIPPFYDKSVMKMYRNIEKNEVDGKRLAVIAGRDKHCADFISALLVKDPEKRLGYNGADEVKKHALWAGTKWGELLANTTVPEYIPPVKSEAGTELFAEDMRNMEIPIIDLTPGDATKANWRVFNAFDDEKKTSGNDEENPS